MQEINLYDLLRYYARNWLNLVSALLIGATIGVIYTAFIQTPLYKSEATMLVVGARTSTTDTTINNNYTELFKSRLVLQTTIKEQGYNGDYDKLLSRTTATNDKDTDVLKVSIADPNASKSQALLKASLESFKNEAGIIYGSSNVKIVDSATLPADAYNVNILKQIGISMLVTLLLVAAILFLVFDYMTNNSGHNESKSKKSSTSRKSVGKKRVTKKKNSANNASAILNRIFTMTIGESVNITNKS